MQVAVARTELKVLEHRFVLHQVERVEHVVVELRVETSVQRILTREMEEFKIHTPYVQ